MNRSTHFKPQPTPQSNYRAILRNSISAKFKGKSPLPPTAPPPLRTLLNKYEQDDYVITTDDRPISSNQEDTRLAQKQSNTQNCEANEGRSEKSKSSKGKNAQTVKSINVNKSTKIKTINTQNHQQEAKEETQIMRPVRFFKTYKVQIVDYATMKPIDCSKHQLHGRWMELGKVMGIGASALVRLGEQRISINTYEKNTYGSSNGKCGGGNNNNKSGSSGNNKSGSSGAINKSGSGTTNKSGSSGTTKDNTLIATADTMKEVPHIHIARKYAVKIYQKYKLQQVAQMRRVQKQIQILLSLDHINIIKLLGAYEDKRQIHLILEYIQNAVTLQDYIRLRRFNLSAGEQRRVAVEVMKGVQYLHQRGIYHRDIKPDNILLTAQNTIKIIDFGFATRCRKTNLSCGTLHFMAPELFHKRQYDAEKTDVWAMGVLLYYLYEYDYPFRGYCEKEIVKLIQNGDYKFKRTPLNMQQIIQIMLCVDPEKRTGWGEIVIQGEIQ